MHYLYTLAIWTMLRAYNFLQTSSNLSTYSSMNWVWKVPAHQSCPPCNRDCFGTKKHNGLNLKNISPAFFYVLIV